MVTKSPTEEASFPFEESPPPPPELEALSDPAHPEVRAPISPSPQSQQLDGWFGFLNNRLLLAALGLVVVLLLTAIVLIAIGRGNASSNDSSSKVVVASGRKTPVPAVGGLVGTTVSTIGFRNGPDVTYPILGTIPRGATVAIVGRSQDSAWLQVGHPATFDLKGWVDAKLLNVDGDVTVLALAGPGPVANAEVTYQPTIAIY